MLSSSNFFLEPNFTQPNSGCTPNTKYPISESATQTRLSLTHLNGNPVPFSSSAPQPLVAAYIPILLSENEQEQRNSRNGDREAIVVGAGLCDGAGERAYPSYEL